MVFLVGREIHVTDEQVAEQNNTRNKGNHQEGQRTAAASCIQHSQE